MMGLEVEIAEGREEEMTGIEEITTEEMKGETDGKIGEEMIEITVKNCAAITCMSKVHLFAIIKICH